jgi:hypothetical protein
LARRDARGGEHAVHALLEHGWHWTAVPLDPVVASGKGFEWRDLRVTPAWNPGLSSFPSDLGIRVHALAVVPDLTPAP